MGRSPRRFSHSKTYHIIIKGIDDQNIFYDERDRKFFLKQVSITKEEFNYLVYAYCLMANHVHMVIKIEDELLSKAIKSLLVRYVGYFNQKYERTGPLVKNRFKSRNIENLKYFLEVCRYVHRNPEKAGIAMTQNYVWSSYREYLVQNSKRKKITDTNVLLHYFDNDLKNFINYTTKTIEIDEIDDMDNEAEFEILEKLSDEDFGKIVMAKFGIADISEIVGFFQKRSREELQEDIKKIRKIKGINKNQVARVLRINRKFVAKFWC